MLDAGRVCFKKWDIRRCEDICWLKTIFELAGRATVRQDAMSVLQHTKVGFASVKIRAPKKGGYKGSRFEIILRVT